MKNIYKVLEGVYSNESLRKTVVPLFIGNPGVGKTQIIEQFAKDKGVKIVELITSQMSPFEISGIAMPDKDSKKMTYFNFDKLENLIDGDILFFDELLNGNPVVLNACLTILEQRRFISGKPLPNIMIVAAANPQGMAPLTPQIKERFVWYDVTFDSKMWCDYMFKKYKLIKPIASRLVSLITAEDFTTNNFNTPRSIDKAVNSIINGLPTPYEPTIKPILETLVENKLGKDVKLEDGRELAVNEKIPWLSLIKGSSITLTVDEELVETIENNTNKYEILMLDANKNVIGEIKDVETLKTMYYFYNEDIEKLENGEIIPPASSHARVFFFFQKKNK